MATKEKREFRDCCNNSMDIFLITDNDLRRINIFQHMINTGNNHSIQQAPRPPIAYMPEDEKLIENMNNQKVIEPSK